MSRHRLRHQLAALHILKQGSKNIAKTRIVRTIPQVADAVEYGYAGPADLFQMEAESDQITPARCTAGKIAGSAIQYPQRDQIKAGSCQTQFQIDLVCGR
ncbi:hypothetical protein GALL_532310 [mine drainage metagenome]|uniref:Uncharacterized protein n=1 Tax=mine drainage metagenome TaxID=410659 RepID=A0A1J5P269_9ZZZZ